jgi:hypothetical protein
VHISIIEYEIIHFVVPWGGIEIWMSVRCARRLPPSWNLPSLSLRQKKRRESFIRLHVVLTQMTEISTVLAMTTLNLLA